ncbi:tetratricopeptide repeat protein [Streptomyces sp. NPDC004610]|uniref:AfsR/SARP family transcriptional regulator n=1 Tax=unclassified Streptomyces TaxID=2593676 RepID=UPI0033BA7DAE
MDIHLLGPVALWVDGGRLELGSVKERALLAALALDIGRPMALDALVERMWDGEPPPNARGNAYTYLSRLRGRLRKADETLGAPHIVSRAHTYTLEADPERVDWHRFQGLVHVAAGTDDQRAVDLFRTADALWAGDALAGLPGVWAETTRRTLAERRLSATITRIAAELRLGRFRGMVAELSDLASRHPDDETLLGQLMLALYGNGRYTDAVRVYEQARRALLRDYGARPGPALERINRGVLNHVPMADLVRAATATEREPAVAATVRPTGPMRDHPPRNLPSQQPLIGRSAELHALIDSLDGTDGSVVLLETVHGMAGVGKTAIAVHTAAHLADRFPDGQIYLDLRAHSPLQEPLAPGAALTTLLRVLGVPSAHVPVVLDEQVDLWRSMLDQRSAIVILDDVADAEQVRPLLPGPTRSLFILTSRRHLTGLPAARSVPLDVLPTGDAITLFRRFAGEQRTRDLTAVAEIVRLCGLLPLAIELVANRFQARTAWTLATLHGRLARTPGRLGEIHDTADHDMARAFDLSYRTLTRSQRVAFRHLSLHPGSDFTVPVAAAVLDLPADATERLLEGLLGCHLLREPVPDRYQYHDLLREYAHRLAHSEDDDETRDEIARRLIGFYVQAVERADRLAFPRRLRVTEDPAPGAPAHGPVWPDAPSARSWLAAERENMLAAVRFADGLGHPAPSARVAFCLAAFLNAECYWQETVDVLQPAVAQGAGTEHRPEELCRALLDLSDALASTGQYPEAAEAGRRALRIARDTGDEDAEAEALRAVGAMEWHRGEHASALDHFQRAYAIKLASGDVWYQARLHNNMGVARLHLGDNDGAFAHFENARDGFARTGDQRSAAIALNNIGDRLFRTRQLDRAREAFETAVSLLTAVGNRYEQATARLSLADVLTELGDTAGALTLCRDALPVYRSLADRKSQADTLISMGEAHRRQGDRDEAVGLLTEALRLAQDIGAAHQEIQALRGIGQSEFEAGRFAAAEEHLRSSAETAARTQALDEAVEAQIVLAEVHLAAGDPAAAHAELRTALATAEAQDHRKTDAIHRRLQELAGHPDI